MNLNYLQNNLILSAVFGLLGAIFTFIESKRSKEKYSFRSYMKIFVLVSLCSYILLYVKLNLINNGSGAKTQYGSGSQSVNLDNYSSVNIGEPTF